MSDLTPRDASTRAADTDRIQVAQLLTDAAAQGRLPLSEYEKRLAEAYAAKTYDELDRLTDDLPGLPEPAHGRGACKPAPSTLLLAILSGFERRGRWNVPGRMTTFTLFGGGVVDLRYADFTSTDASSSLDAAAEALAHGEAVGLYPEGRLTRDPAMWPERAKTGAVRLALRTGAPIVPVAMVGAHEVVGRRLAVLGLVWNLIRRPNVEVSVGAPVDVLALANGRREPPKEVVREIADVVMAELIELVGDLRDAIPAHPTGVPREEPAP